MNSNLTINGRSFNLSYSDKAGSERRNTTRGVSLPEVMTIKHQQYTDKASGTSGVRSVLRFDRHVTLSSGDIRPTSAYLVVVAPTDSGVTSTDAKQPVLDLLTVLNNNPAVAGLDLTDAIALNKEQ